IAATHSEPNLVTPELCLFRHIPLRFPSAISRQCRIPFANNPASITLAYAPVHGGPERDHEAAKDGNVARQPLHLYGVARTIKIAIGDDLGVRSVRRGSGIKARGKSSRLGKLQCWA